MALNISWSTYADGNTLVSVGGEAVCMIGHDVLCFTNLKTNEMRYYAAHSAEHGRSIAAIAGHNNFNLLAFAEAVVMPSIYILEYPQLTKYTVFENDNILEFVDLKFNEYDLLIGLTGRPQFSICIWNFRTGQKLLQHDTMVICLEHSLTLSTHHMPQIAQYSEWNKTIIIWEMCSVDSETDIYEVSRIDLSNFNKTPYNHFPICYTDDNMLYHVDSYGNLSLVDIARFRLIHQWNIPMQVDKVDKKLGHYSLFSYKSCLLVKSSQACYCVRKKSQSWIIEWCLESTTTTIRRIVSNISGNLYAATPLGNVYQIKLSSASGGKTVATLSVVHDFNVNCIDFVPLKAVPEDCILQMTNKGKINALDLSQIRIISSITVEKANVIVSHNIGAYAVIATTTGKLHFFNYGKPSNPIEVGNLQLIETDEVASMDLFDNLLMCRNVYYSFFLIHVDFSNNTFYQISHIEYTLHISFLLKYFVGEDNHVFFFLRTDTKEKSVLPFATELWTLCWVDQLKNVKRRIYNLPYKYRAVTNMKIHLKNLEEIYAVRLDSTIIDILHIYLDSRKLVIMQSLRTNHMANILGVHSSRNILTWSIDSIFLHFRSHKKSSDAYMVSHCITLAYRPFFIMKAIQCCSTRYGIFLDNKGTLLAIRIESYTPTIVLNSNVLESKDFIKPHDNIYHKNEIKLKDLDVVVEYSSEQLQERQALVQRVQLLAKEVTALIDYDISVTGETEGVYRKFCLNLEWLQQLTEEANKLCEAERTSLMNAVTDQARVRDWILSLINKYTDCISYRIRALLSNSVVENFGLRKRPTAYDKDYNLFRLYDMEPPEDAEVEKNGEDISEVVETEEIKVEGKRRKYFMVEGSVYDHILSDELALQDINLVTSYQMYNQSAKYKTILVDLLKEEFNKMFMEIYKFKTDLLDSITQTNEVLNKIFDNMNCMLKLLKLEEFNPPELYTPQWKKDEIIKRIMEVDDSEIKAINRRKKKGKVIAQKPGRLLLWSVEFWVRSLIVMMDGVLEKLWEEEIKKDIPIPEFVLKKQPAEYTLEDQKMFREYEEKVHLLTADRKKYLNILLDNEEDTKEQKNNYILRLNESITQLMIRKLKYDYAIKHVRLRNLNTILMHFSCMNYFNEISVLRDEADLMGEYILRYTKLSDIWDLSVKDLTTKLENMNNKDKTLERQFKTNYLTTVPSQLCNDLIKAYKRRPKLPPKILNSMVFCKDLALHVASKTASLPFPVPKESQEFLESLNAFDDTSSMPSNLEAKFWLQLVKLRRQKIEHELKLKATNLQLADVQNVNKNFIKEIENLSNAKSDSRIDIIEAQNKYLFALQNQTLELRLTLGQVETNILYKLPYMRNCILMHEDDINDINALIIKTGELKLKAMHKVAFFRRQIIYKEWEHMMTSANISNLKYILHAINKCKVTMEFLKIIRNWEKVKAEKQKMLNAVGLIEKARESKLLSARKNLQRLNAKIAGVREQVEQMKHSNQHVNRQIDDVKVSVSLFQTNRDYLIEEKIHREQKIKMDKIKKHASLIEAVRRDHAKILELKTLLELQYLRTYPMLEPRPSECQ